MANPHWDFTLQLTPGTLAKAEDVNTNLAGIDAGFVSVTTDMNQALKVINGPGVVDINLNAAARANKIVSFDGSGGVLASIYIGNYQGNHAAAAGTFYNVRDTVKDSTGALGQDNIYICNTSHTSTGTLLTDTANWDILVDVAAVAVSAAAALVSENNAAATYDLFDDRVLGEFTTANEPTLDNDGNALLVSAMYYNSDTLKWRSWTGSTWADQNLGLGISDSALATVLTILADATVSVAGEFEVIHTSIAASEHAMSIIKDAAGFSDAMALQIAYAAGALAALTDTSVINVNIDKTTTVGGRVLALNVDATDGTADAVAVSAGVGVDPIHQSSGTLINPTFASNNTTATDVLTMRDGSNGTTNAIMVNDNDYIIAGAAAAFSAMEVSLTVISSKNIQAQYFYSITGTNQFTEFFPTDGTSGMQNSGTISWDLSSFVGHVADAVTGTFNVKITRTRNGSITNPVLGHITTASAVEYSWDKDSILKVKSLLADTSMLLGGEAELAHFAGIRPFRIGQSGLIFGQNSGLTLFMANNYYLDSGSNDTAIFTGRSSIVRMNQTSFAILVSPSTTAGGIPSFKTPVSIDNDSGDVTIATPAGFQALYQKPPLTTGTASAYIATLGITSYVSGTVYKLRIHVTNSGAATLNIDGVGIQSIALLTTGSTTDTVAGDLSIDGVYEFMWNGTDFILLNPSEITGNITATLTPGSGTITLNSTNNKLLYNAYRSTCRVQGAIDVSSISTPSGTLQLAALPFPTISGTPSPVSPFACGQIVHQSLASAVSIGLSLVPAAGGTTVLSVVEQTTTTRNLNSAAFIGVGARLYINFEYMFRK